eukprot:UN27004
MEFHDDSFFLSSFTISVKRLNMAVFPLQGVPKIKTFTTGGLDSKKQFLTRTSSSPFCHLK